MRKSILIPIAVLAMITGCVSMFSSYEEPRYKVVKTYDEIEIRDYSGMIVAEVITNGDKDKSINQGFRILADFIFGNNVPAEKLSMTIPVTQQQDKQTVAMTAPVTQQPAQDGSWKIRFTMPSEYTMKTLPKPKDDRIKLIQIEPYKAAVIRFSGTSREKNSTEHKEKLEAFMMQEKLIAAENVTYAYYNPPWTPWFMKRNEVIIPLKD